MNIPVLVTGRLIVREYTADDLDAQHNLIGEAFGSAGTLDETRQWLAWMVTNYSVLAGLHQPPYGDYAVELQTSGEVIGSVGLVPARVPWDALDGKPGPHLVSPEFGLFWAIRPAWQQQGYATEAARALVDFVFSGLSARRLVATTEHDNVASQGVMRRLGMTLRRNPGLEPFWCQVVGVLDHPDAR